MTPELILEMVTVALASFAIVVALVVLFALAIPSWREKRDYERKMGLRK